MTWDVFPRKEKFCSRADPNCRLQNTRTCSFNAPITMPSKHQQTQGGLSISHQSHQNRQINGCRCRYPTPPPQPHTQKHTHNWGSKQSHMHDPTIFQNKAYRCQTRGPKALQHSRQLSYKKCHFDIFYHFNTSFYNIPFIRCYIFQFYTLK